LLELGYVEGKNVLLEYRAANGRRERVPGIANEIAAARPDVIVVFGGDMAPFAKQATTTIPIVTLVSYDPVETGLVGSLSRPGGNVTGVAYVSSETAGKRLQFLREAMPRLNRLGVLWNPDHPDGEYRHTLDAARIAGMRVVSLEVGRSDDFDAAFQMAQAQRVEVILVAASRFMNLNQKRVAEFAQAQRIPVISGWGPWATGGGLMSYGPDLNHLVRRMAVHVDRVLKGTRPEDLPVELPTKFDLVINLKTARNLGVTIPPSLVLQAARVIE
jgi:putative ABC transport system substrate-binding protein